MKDFTILPADNFLVVNKTILSDECRKILSILYQPIIGSNAVNLFFTLWSKLDNNNIKSLEYTHYNLCSSMQLSLNDICIARKKLEAVGLLKTYFKKGSINSYIYELYSPVSANNFFNHPILSILLYSTVEKEEYNKIVNYFKLPKYNLDDFVNVTASFSDVFKISSMEKSFIEEDNVQCRNTNELVIENNLDFNLIKESLPTTSVSDKTFNDEIKNLIKKLAFIYDLDNMQVVEIVRVSLEKRGIINKISLRKNARNFYQFEHNGKLPLLIAKTQPDNLKSKISDSSNKSKMIYTFDNTRPYDFLKSKQNGAEPTKRDLNLIEKLAIDYELTPGVINVLIDYVLKVNNNKLTTAFVETIAGEWKRRKIEKVEDAVRIAIEEHKNHVAYTKKSQDKEQKDESKTPEWFNKNVEKNHANKEEQEQMNQLLNSFK